jgi:Na+/H+-dicarboxylate symporter
MKIRKKPGLLLKIIFAIISGIVFSFFLPDWAVRIFVTFNGIFGNYLSFVIPLIILGLVAPGIADLGKGAGKLLAVTALIAYGSTVLSGFFSFFTTRWSLPLLLSQENIVEGKNISFSESLAPFFEIEMPALMEVTTALLFAFVIGIGVSSAGSELFKKLLSEFRDLIVLVITKSIIPLLPYYIFGIFLKIGAEGQVFIVLGLFFKVIIIIFVMHVILLVTQFVVAGFITKKNPFRALYNMLPAYMTALGTQSSAATIPITLIQAKKNDVDEDIADFVVPLCATIHLSGSILKIVSCAFAVMYLTGLNPDIGIFAGFIMMLGITMVAAPGVPGGAIMAAVALLQSMLGFDETLVGLMIALYITMDSFGTAGNVTGDGAIAMIVNRISK